MPNVLYAKGKQNLLDAGFDLNTNTIKVALTDHAGAEGAPNTATHDAYDDIDGSTVGTPQTLTSPTITDGVFDAANTTFTAITGASVESFTVYKDTGTPATSLLLVYIDSTSPPLPVTPNGGDIVIAWNASGIFAL